MDPVKPSVDSCLGMLEIGAVPTGIACLDATVKQASVAVLIARPITPAKYVVLIEGSVEAVGQALAAGSAVAGDRLLGRLLLAQPHPDLLAHLSGSAVAVEPDALGVVETETVCAAIVGADGALKVGAVRLIELRMAMGLGGRAFFTLAGEVSSVEAAVQRAQLLAADDFVDGVVIPRPDEVTTLNTLDPRSPFSDLP